MKTLRTVVLLALALAAMAAVAGPASAAAPGTRLQAALHGSSAFPNANGKADFRQRGDERELQVEVEDAKPLAGTSLKVFVDGRLAGMMRINRLGNGNLNRNTENGQSVPAVHVGSKVRVRTAGGTLVVSGAFS